MSVAELGRRGERGIWLCADEAEHGQLGRNLGELGRGRGGKQERVIDIGLISRGETVGREQSIANGTPAAAHRPRERVGRKVEKRQLGQPAQLRWDLNNGPKARKESVTNLWGKAASKTRVAQKANIFQMIDLRSQTATGW